MLGHEGLDECYGIFISRMFKEREEEEEELDETYAIFLSWMFEEDIPEQDGGQDVYLDEIEIEYTPNENEGSSRPVGAGGNGSPNEIRIDQNRQGTIENLNPLARLFRDRYALTCTSTASLIAFSLAFDQAVTSGAASYVNDDWPLSDAHHQIVMGILGMFMLVGVVLAGINSDFFGRRRTIVAGGFLLFLGAVIMGCSPSFHVFMMGRLLANFGAGFAGMIVPVYFAEISPTVSRGAFISFLEVFLSIGTLLGNLSNYIFSLKLGWRLMVSMSAIPSVMLGLAVFALPESPQWLVMQGQWDQANQIICKISNSTEEAALWLDDIKKAIGVSEEGNGDNVTNVNQIFGVWRDIFHPTRSIFHLLVCAVLIQFLQEACGIDTLLLYSPQIFERVHITTSFGQLVATAILDMVKIVFVLVATFLVDRVGRRPLLLSSIGGLVFWLVSLGVFFILTDHHSHKKLSWAVDMLAVDMCCISMIFYTISYSIGLGPITGVYCSEIFPPRLHAQGYTIGVGVKYAVKIGLSLMHLWIYKAATLGGAAIVCAGIAFLGWVPLYMVMPETKGLKLEEMGRSFGKFIKWRSALRDEESQRTSDTTEAAARVVEMQSI